MARLLLNLVDAGLLDPIEDGMATSYRRTEVEILSGHYPDIFLRRLFTTHNLF